MIDNIEPVVQGLVTALVVIALVVLYVDRMSTISHNLDNISSSMEKVHEDIQEVDLKKMETTNNKLETFLDAQLKSGYQQQAAFTGGQNSVEYELPRSEISVTVSYVGSPEWHAGLKSLDGYDGDETIFEIKFNEEVNTQGVVGMLVSDRELSEREYELFGDANTRLSAHSPYLITSSVPSGDLGMVSKWVEITLNKTDEKISEIRELNEEFDTEVIDQLN